MNSWALKVYTDWAQVHRGCLDELKVTETILLTDIDELCGELCNLM